MPVTFRGEVGGVAPDNIDRAIGNLEDTWQCARLGDGWRCTLTPAEWYREYERIHAWIDGNGRTGALWFNYLNGTLHEPTIPDVTAL